MGNPSVPGCVLSIKKLHAPGVIPSAQPALLCGSLARDGGIGNPQLPVSLPGHVHLPIVATMAVCLRTDDIQGSVKSAREVRELLPGFSVGGAVTTRGDNQLWVGRLRIQMYHTGICKGQKSNALHKHSHVYIYIYI